MRAGKVVVVGREQSFIKGRWLKNEREEIHTLQWRTFSGWGEGVPYT